MKKRPIAFRVAQRLLCISLLGAALFTAWHFTSLNIENGTLTAPSVRPVPHGPAHDDLLMQRNDLDIYQCRLPLSPTFDQVPTAETYFLPHCNGNASRIAPGLPPVASLCRQVKYQLHCVFSKAPLTDSPPSTSASSPTGSKNAMVCEYTITPVKYIGTSAAPVRLPEENITFANGSTTALYTGTSDVLVKRDCGPRYAADYGLVIVKKPLAPKRILEGRMSQRKWTAPERRRTPQHVHVYFIDAMSRTNFMRTYPKTRSLLRSLRKQRRAYVFGGYTAVHMFSPPNQRAFWAGLSTYRLGADFVEPDTPEAFIPGLHKLTVKTLWEEAYDKGMRVGLGITSHLFEGFDHRADGTTDHAFSLENNFHGARYEHVTPYGLDFCMGGRNMMEPFHDYLRLLTKTYAGCPTSTNNTSAAAHRGDAVAPPNSPASMNVTNARTSSSKPTVEGLESGKEFATKTSTATTASYADGFDPEAPRIASFAFSDANHQQDVRYGLTIDGKLERYIHDISTDPALADSVTLIIADHGSQWAAEAQFRGERYLPLAAMVLGETFARRLNAADHENLMHNERAVLTSLDFYRTILAAIDPTITPKWRIIGPRGQSVISTRIGARSMASVGIQSDKHPCNDQQPSRKEITASAEDLSLVAQWTKMTKAVLEIRRDGQSRCLSFAQAELRFDQFYLRNPSGRVELAADIALPSAVKPSPGANQTYHRLRYNVVVTERAAALGPSPDTVLLEPITRYAPYERCMPRSADKRVCICDA